MSTAADFRKNLAQGRSGLPYLYAGEKSAPRVVCLHGFPSLPDSFGPLAELLVGEGFRVEAPFLPGYGYPGYGESPAPDPFSLEKVASRIEDFMAEGPKVALLVAHDWGGLLAWLMAARRRITFDSVATLSINHPALFIPKVLGNARQFRQSLYVFGFQFPLVPEACMRDRETLEDLYRSWSPNLDLGTIEPHLDAVHTSLRHDTESPLAYYRDILNLFRLPGRLNLVKRHRVKVPAVHLHGQLDGSIAPSSIAGQSAYFESDYEEFLYEGAGHFLPLERPAEIAPRLIELLKRVGH